MVAKGTEQRNSPDHERVSDLVAEAFPRARGVSSMHRLHGGSKKGVYRLALADGTTAILYAWLPEENFWQRPSARQSTGSSSVFDDASGLALYVAAQDRLDSIGVRTPQLFGVAGQPDIGDLAIIEDVPEGA